MPRSRAPRKVDSKEKDASTSKKPSASKRPSAVSHSTRKSRGLANIPVLWLVAPTVVMTLLAFVVVFTERWLAGPLVNMPLDAPRVVSEEWRNDSEYRERLWGTYRSNIYFGVRPRLPQSLLSGLMWFTYDTEFNIRHSCEHGDHLQRYGWLRHDGTNFGEQEIVDNVMNLKTEFLARSESGMGETWTARITGQPRINRPILVSLILYMYNEGAGDMAFVTSQRNSVEEIYGYTPDFSQFRVYFPKKTVSQDALHNYMSARRSSVTDLAGFVKSVMKMDNPHKNWPTIARLPGDVKQVEDTNFKPNLVAYQITTRLPFEIDMVFESGMFSAALSISGERLTSALQEKRAQFDQRFEETFGLKAKGFSDGEVSFAKAAFSNLVGGISYFYGQSRVIAPGLSKPVNYWPAELYTAVPSRSFFPRGFLWDEGFHQLLVAHWDTSIVKDVLAHWMDLLNVEGWIPREQILGDEARSKVPPEFVVQHSENANPPTFFLTVETLLQRMQKEDKMDLVFLRLLYPRLVVWFDWFNTTQLGEQPTTYRWRGRNETTNRELNPKTLTSGLDDYPRASHPSLDEYHVDLRCWMALASEVIAKIADLLGENSFPYKTTRNRLTDQRLLDRLHWDKKRKTYSDYGLHTSAVKLVKVHPQQPNLPTYKKRKVMREPMLRHVNSFGYVNLFPFLLRIVSPSSDKLGYILERLRNKSLLWTDYGIRSLARNDPFYNKYNTEHDPPYWRGAIWLNMNYLCVRALHYYGNRDGPYRVQARELYEQLRANLIQNMHEQYVRTGYIWEQYDDDIGTGKGTHPFTGWSSLIVLIMAEKF